MTTTHKEGVDNKSRVYLDYAAATPVHPTVLKAMTPYFTERYANPSAIHAEGRVARAAVESARSEIAVTLGIKSAGVVFTSGGTESNNLALLGYLRTLFQTGRAYADMEVVTTAIEHPATTQALAEAATWGVVVRHVPLTETGLVHPASVADVLNERTVLVSVALVNSEIGVIQPTQAIARQLRKYHVANSHMKPIALHVDAAQAPLWLSCRLDRLGADMVSFDAGKCAGPKGVGVLALQRVNVLQASVGFGGGQESSLRPGTEPVPLVVGMAAALVRGQEFAASRTAAMAAVRDAALSYIYTHVPEAVLNGPTGAARVANNINISVAGYDTEFAAVVLDQCGYAVSTKSACSSSDSAASSVVYAVSEDQARARSTLRLTWGEEIVLEDVTGCIDVLREHITKMQPYRQQ